MALPDLTANKSISTTKGYLEATRLTQELGVQYVSAIKGYYYNVFVCKLPCIEPNHARYKLFVRESKPIS